MRDAHRVVITGMGAISPFGIGVPAFFDGLREGRSGTRRVTLVDDPAIPSQVAAEVPDFDPSAYVASVDVSRVPRVVPMALGAGREACAQAGLDLEELSLEARRDLAVLVGTGGGGIEFAEQQYAAFYGHGDRRVTPYCVSSSFVGMLSSEMSIALGLRGPSHVVSTGCTSSTDAIGYAYHMIRSGVYSAALTGGAEACITRGLLAGFARMRVVATKYNEVPARASKPFDRERDGFVLGEGAWMFMLESLERARDRGATILAEIVGYAATCDAYHRVAMNSDGVESARAMQLAMESAGVAPEEVDYVNLHGTATKMNDVVETRALKLAFHGTAFRLAASATKSQIGHPQGACGAAGMMAGVFSLLEQCAPPTINYEREDPECDLDYTPNQSKPREIRHVVCNAIAFGSKNSALVLRRWDAGGRDGAL